MLVAGNGYAAPSLIQGLQALRCCLWQSAGTAQKNADIAIPSHHAGKILDPGPSLNSP